MLGSKIPRKRKLPLSASRSEVTVECVCDAAGLAHWRSKKNFRGSFFSAEASFPRTVLFCGQFFFHRQFFSADSSFPRTVLFFRRQFFSTDGSFPFRGNFFSFHLNRAQVQHYESFLTFFFSETKLERPEPPQWLPLPRYPLLYRFLTGSVMMQRMTRNGVNDRCTFNSFPMGGMLLAPMRRGGVDSCLVSNQRLLSCCCNMAQCASSRCLKRNRCGF